MFFVFVRKKDTFVFSYSVEPLSDTAWSLKRFPAPWLLSTVLNTHLTTAFIRKTGRNPDLVREIPL